MKKTLALVLAIALLALSVMGLAACGEKHTCWICEEEKTGCEKDTFLGETIYTCKDCLNDMEELEDELEDFGEDLEDALS